MSQRQQARRDGNGLRAWAERLRPRAHARDARRRAAHRLYCALVNQARTPCFFAELGVPDTPEGRFEMIGLHAALLLRRLRAEGAAGQALGQALFDLMFADLDASLRELGVGDLSVGRHVKRYAGYFYARLGALDEALTAGDPAGLRPMLEANVYRGGRAPTAEQVARLADQLMVVERALAGQAADRLLRGEVAFTGG
jgi:cytochrome b pre-mRNA-processing protein 3